MSSVEYLGTDFQVPLRLQLCFSVVSHIRVTPVLIGEYAEC